MELHDVDFVSRDDATHGCEALRFPEHSEDKVFRFDEVAVYLAGLISCVKENASRRLGISLEHSG
jgi:hypothetical protein